MQDVRRVDVFEAAEDLVDEGLEVSVGQGLTGTNDRSEIAFHQLCAEVFVLVLYLARVCSVWGEHTLVKICLVEVVGSGNVHIIQASDLGHCC